MNIDRPLVRVAALGAAGAMVLAAAPAMAKPPVKPDPVTGLQFSITKPAYTLSASWDKAAHATSYQVVVKNQAGTTLDSARVSATSWTDSLSPAKVSVGAELTLTVRSYNGSTSQKGKVASSTQTVKDMTPPEGSYNLTVDKYSATLDQTALSDNAGAAGVTRTVDWGDGSGAQPWTSGTSLTHPYTDQGTYDVVVTLTDAAGNTATLARQAVIVDHAPTGAFDITQPDPDYWVTVTQTGLADDITDNASLTRVIDWGDGSAPETMTTDTAQHQYPDPGTDTVRYTPSVTITDTARPEANSTTVDLHAVVVNDHTAPTGSFTLNRTTAWASYNRVTLSQTALDDGAGSPAAFITRSVDWGDGTVVSWTSGTTLNHVYAAAGTFTPTVTLTDEAGNQTDPAISAGSVTVTKDTAAPVVKFKYPAKPRYVVKKWRTLRGTATDAGVGASRVHLQVVEKRGRTYYAYKWSTHRWVKAGTRVGAAWQKAGTVSLRTSSTHTWSRSVAGLRKGVLTYRANAVDKVGNTSSWVAHSQKLTR